MKKFSRSALKEAKAKARELKNQIKQEELEANENQPPEEPHPDVDLNSDAVKSLIKKGFKATDITPAMIELHENKANNLSKKIVYKRNPPEKKEKVSWNISDGDLVAFRYNNEEKFGIVLEIKDGEDMRTHQTLVVSSIGRNWHHTSGIKKIN